MTRVGHVPQGRRWSGEVGDDRGPVSAASPGSIAVPVAGLLEGHYPVSTMSQRQRTPGCGVTVATVAAEAAVSATTVPRALPGIASVDPRPSAA